jgi:hypothetical protein
VLTQLLTAAVLVTMAERRTPGMCRCMTSDRSPTRFMRCRAGLCVGALGATMVAALVPSLALAWCFGEIAGAPFTGIASVRGAMVLRGLLL